MGHETTSAEKPLDLKIPGVLFSRIPQNLCVQFLFAATAWRLDHWEARLGTGIGDWGGASGGIGAVKAMRDSSVDQAGL